MSNGSQKRTRQQRVASVELPPGIWGTLVSQIQRGSVLLRLSLCALVALLLWAFTRGWDPPFNHRLGEIPARNSVARVDFEQPDLQATKEAEDRARQLAFAVYDQKSRELFLARVFYL